MSAQDHAAIVEAQFAQEAELGAMLKIDARKAKEEYGADLAVASLGSLEKRDGSYRVVHDATHGLKANSRVRLRDQLERPTAANLRRSIQQLPGATFSLCGDIKRAHRLVRIRRSEWGLLACEPIPRMISASA